MMHAVLLCTVGFWSKTAETPVISVPITPNGGTFTDWKESDTHIEHKNCNWWNGTYYYDPGVCNAFSITRVSSGDVSQAIQRAQHCMMLTDGESECVLNGEIGFSVPSAFLYDHTTSELRMLIAPRYVNQAEPSPAKTIRMQDPRWGSSGGDDTHIVHPNQLFEFNTTVTVEYLKGGARKVETEQLNGQEAYCVQALRRSIAPACWESLD